MAALLEIGQVSKDSTNDFHGYDYTSEAAVTSRVRETLVEAGLFVSSVEVVDMQEREIDGRNGRLQFVTVRLRIKISDDRGNVYGPYEAVGQGSDHGDKAAAKAMTQARKYCLAGAAMISWGDDPEADTRTDRATHNQTQKPQRPAARAVSSTVRKPEGVDLFMSLLLQNSKVSSEALEEAWNSVTGDPTITAACRDYVSQHHNGTWLNNLRAKAENADRMQQQRRVPR